MWCDKLLLLIAFLIAIKEYKKLDEIINWTIIDLKVSGNYALLKRQVNSKRIFSKICTYLFIGTLLLIITEFAGLFCILCLSYYEIIILLVLAAYLFVKNRSI